MGFFDFFLRKKPEDYEKKGDAYFKKEFFGQAKIAYDKAESMSNFKPSLDSSFRERINDKIQQSCEGLAQQHFIRGKELIEADCIKDAGEFFTLALELTKNETLASELEQIMIQTQKTQVTHIQDRQNQDEDPDENHNNSTENFIQESIEMDDSNYEERFEALCSTLTQKEQSAYNSYGDDFIKGFVDLNQGQFDSAAQRLAMALETQVDGKNYIRLELATCHLNMGNYEKAVDLLEQFLKYFPDSLRGYEILCETLWASGDFRKAENLLNTCSEKIADSLLIHLLKGETLFQEERYDEAENYYRELITKRGREGLILRALAKTIEAAGNPKAAKDIYSELMASCNTCGRRPDFYLRLGFADTSFASGEYSDQLIDIYLNLAMEDPEHQPAYYKKVSTIYAELGNLEESRRYKAFAKQS